MIQFSKKMVSRRTDPMIQKEMAKNYPECNATVVPLGARNYKEELRI